MGQIIMTITLPKYATNYNLCPIKTEEEANKFDMTFEHNPNADYTIYWGCQTQKLHQHKKYGVMETGFFHEAAFIDTVGAYQCSSLNTKFALSLRTAGLPYTQEALMNSNIDLLNVYNNQ